MFGLFRNYLKLFLWLICRLVWLWYLVSTKDVKKKSDMRVVKGKFYQKFPKTLVLVFGHNLAYEPPSWMILVGHEP